MPRLRTDDGPRKLRAVWLGPAGHTLPFQWSYVQWALTLILVVVSSTVGTVVVWLVLRDPVWAFGIGTLWFGAAGVYLAVRLMRNVTFDEPLSYQRRMVGGEFSSKFSRPVGARKIAVTFEVPPIGYLSPAARKCMDWDDLDGQKPLPADTTAAEPSPVQLNPYLALSPRSPATAPAPGSPSIESSAPSKNPYLTSSRS